VFETSAILMLVLTAYLGAAVLYVASLVARDSERARPTARLATALAGVGVLAHTLGLFALVAETGRSPYSTVYGALAFMAWLVVLMQLGMVGWARLYALGAISLPVAFLMLLCALALPPELRQLLPLLRQHTMAAHISMAILGYGAFAVAFGLAVLYLLENRLLKARKLRGLLERLPPLRTTEELASRFAAFGHAMLSLGLIIGTVAGLREARFHFWSDPKVLPALITWGIYTAYLVLRWGIGWRGRTASYLLVAGFVAVLVTFVGINLLFPGMHGAVR